MIELGVTNLNLHQLRLTPYNAQHLVNKGYTIINAEKPVVLESELAALEIMNYATENDLEIGVNYCSFFFKHRFQKAGFRKQIAKLLAAPNAEITQNGYIRELNANSICYKSIRLYNNIQNQLNLKEIEINNKTYYYIEEYALNEKNLSEEDVQNIKQLLKEEPINIPNDPLLFRIWQLEYIEKGLRDY